MGQQPGSPHTHPIAEQWDVRKGSIIEIASHGDQVALSRRPQHIPSRERAIFNAGNTRNYSSPSRASPATTRQVITQPPLMSMVAPVMKEARSLTRKATTFAISSGWDERPTGIWLR